MGNHDDNHKSADGRVITQDCGACHAVLAMEESDPKVLEKLGLKQRFAGLEATARALFGGPTEHN